MSRTEVRKVPRRMSVARALFPWTVLAVAFCTLHFAWPVGWASAAEPPAAPAGSLLIEAERFDDYGGWVDDSQFMDQMGSPFLLAHGLGTPVKDAATTVTLARPGRYRVWVRTRDWVAPWNAPGAPGRFQVLVDGRPLEATFGTEGAAWHWQDGGCFQVEQGELKLRLHDLTGFDGRCDAILLVPEPPGRGGPRYRPPDAEPRLAALRRQLSRVPGEPADAGNFDLVVVGGGIAGTCAAVSAARHGLRVALIQDRPVLGGNNSSEVRVWLHGARNLPPYPHIGDIVAELEQERRAHYGPDNTAEIYEDQKKLDVVRAEENIALYLLHRANEVETEGPRITAVIAEHTRSGRRTRFPARLFADCTGDGCIGYLAGAHYEMTSPGHMGRCNLWHAVDTGRPQPFPRCPWALDLADKPFPGRAQKSLNALGGWYWESGFEHDPIVHAEAIRDWNFRAAFGAWDALKNVDNAFPNHRLNWMAHIAGKRESRRLLGDVVLTKEDLLTGKRYPDGCVPTGWKIDVHIPDQRYEEGFEGNAFISKALFTDYPRPYWVPYRCLYSRNIENLFMAGRDISVTHEALGATRVMRTGGCMGEVVGIAAALCVEHATSPRGVWRVYPDEFLARVRQPAYADRGEKLPHGLLDRVGRNVALEAAIDVSGTHEHRYGAAFLNDGIAAARDNQRRWISRADPESCVELRFDQPQRVSAARIVSGYVSPQGTIVGALEDFVLQVYDDAGWREIPGTAVKGNRSHDWHALFDPVESRRFRLRITRTPDRLARIWEVQLFCPPEP